jgi:hypothetical protein
MQGGASVLKNIGEAESQLKSPSQILASIQDPKGPG